ncbi:phosphohistidine phosphatase, SixA [Thalassoporum mexicanum PCC 7367]|uniref:phosphohistidine phosphatase SixA n=1 Tax=Thalassoporum mexicanum TaxID=3457544 RepID=UPI00029FBC54|nr:phosphohistidine phosphatase SixA [Pseudanabaena sp. PCC 7367]AFY68927.1 phosphohistidine phosphatase, SixA [Pseudanabaena sp. PCC 7367]
MTKVSIYFIRHGIAADRAGYDRDGDRPLTEEGHKKTKKIARKLNHLGLKFDLVQHSPLVRAKQTAAIFAEQGYPIAQSEYLAPEGDFQKWLDWFRNWQESGISPGINGGGRSDLSLGLIGHEPDLSAWAEVLLWGEVRSVLVLKKAGIIGLAVPEPETPIANSLLFMLIPPKILL